MSSKPRIPGERTPLLTRVIAGTTLLTFLATPPYAMAALTDIANAPLASASTAQIPPNIMFILDGSGSMDSDYMPDGASSYAGRVGGKSHLCNTIYYNPSITYPLPKNPDGSDFANATYTNAKRDGFPSNDPSGSVNLSSSFQPNGSSSSEPAYYYAWGGAAWDTLTASQKNTECDRDDSSSFPHTTGSWTKVRVTTATTQQNFANWYSFYRTRMMMMKSAAGRAFAGLNDSFRVGFITICPQDGSSCSSDTSTVTVSPSKYLKIDNFGPTHKQAWFDKFYIQRGSGYTPLRQSLSRVGRHYAGIKTGINSGMPEDPIQFSCQQNFAILTTDGYWNYGYGQKIDGTTMTNEDANLALTPRPMYDGGATSTVVVEQRYRFRSTSGGGCGGTTVRAREDRQTTTTDQSGNSTSSGWSEFSGSVCVPKSTFPGYAFPPDPPSNTTSATTVLSTTTTSVGSVPNTLADVAEYYYRNDLRPTGSLNAAGVDVSTNNVPQAGTGPEDDRAQHQHMTTFTLGMGLSGQLDFKADYKSGTGDFPALRTGAKSWPDPNPSSSGGANSAQNLARIDDLWHAAVNGRGQAFSATDPASLAVSLQTALSAIQVRLSSAAAAATSSLEPTLTDRLVFTPTYTTGEWSGDLAAHELDLATGMVLPTPVWSAQAKLNNRAKTDCDTRKILLHRPGAGATNLVDFTWDSYGCDGSGAKTGGPGNALNASEKAFFASTQVATLTQWGLMTDGTAPTVNQRAAAEGANLVNFVRGQRGKEDFTPDNLSKLYRARKHVLGNIVNSQPVYVRQPFFDYSDTGYGDFKTAQAGRTPMVYSAANDGLLHAFYAGTSVSDTQGGEEAWAVMPREVLPRVHKLADTNWSKLHEYTVDATPAVGDVYDTATTSWKTILVAGLNKGGRAYYALDITDPVAPKMLWEFNNASDSDLGYSFGNPVITKLENGKWVVFVTSGLNNVTPGDGKGYLYVLDAITGAIIHKIGTNVGSTGTPSGLTKIRNWVSVNPALNNTTARVYGVDLEGNVWRFDVNNHLGNASPIAERLATVKDPAGNPQPLTTRPELAEVGSPPVPFVYVATGRYLGPTDVTNTQVQSVYAIRDPLTAAAPANLRSELKKLTMTTDGTNRYATCNTGDVCDPAKGWFIDLMDTGERVNVDMKLQLGTLVVASNVPGNTSCEPGGFSYKNYFDYQTGLAPAGSTTGIGGRLSSALAVGINVIRLPDGRVVVIAMDSSGAPQTFQAPIASGEPTGKRITWREIAQ